MFHFFGKRPRRQKRVQKRSARPCHRRLLIEPLEQRALLAVSFTLNVSVTNLPAALKYFQPNPKWPRRVVRRIGPVGTGQDALAYAACVGYFLRGGDSRSQGGDA